MQNEANSVGGIVARLQVPELHSGHRYLIDFAKARHDRLAIILGETGGYPTDHDPLPFEMREEMVREMYPDDTIDIKPLEDDPISHERWSENLDALLRTQYGDSPITLYGGAQESFIAEYTTKTYPTVAVPLINPSSGTVIRNKLLRPRSADAREMLIYEHQHRKPKLYRTVDIAIISRNRGEVILIGKNKHAGLLSFLGGFAEVDGASDEADVLREKNEELPNVSAGQIVYLGSYPIDDPRYRKGKDRIRTTFFRTNYESGNLIPGDDADHAEWVPVEKLLDVLVPWHHILGETLQKHWWDR
ncbi:MAG: NUDIX hydrolase [Candidatus Kaiserbacteria bacterium GW2011_GWB1_52_6]|uniref:NUDIX hydrolase n=2 Tax=Candidatus Kaiseribacteriota TaxID=1752734 RepID=A0A0G2A750_9BACT|nr:MAG: NUDIX hydrolase [Candidatus Kaiserbacteria bacterium GW2011_GWA2_52_12]KKW28129.1 MAG: NUDIX hydrolase [Candidatus Kaiserbacteria bacterium GW2011_GWB1_52_6]